MRGSSQQHELILSIESVELETQEGQQLVCLGQAKVLPSNYLEPQYPLVARPWRGWLGMGMTRMRLLCSNFRASHRNCKDMAIQVFYMGTCTIPFVLAVHCGHIPYWPRFALEHHLLEWLSAPLHNDYNHINDHHIPLSGSLWPFTNFIPWLLILIHSIFSPFVHIMT